MDQWSRSYRLALGEREKKQTFSRELVTFAGILSETFERESRTGQDSSQKTWNFPNAKETDEMLLFKLVSFEGVGVRLAVSTCF